ncbi:oligopeptide/dipeptide ABC transporter ATP-binding protein, partial [Vacuolonema iberomarrocanum]|uniref:oligopeptide/dipeptide ABC transporter ATP-binding protein n=1 Tax=Vacuolonema iberomarrocanum TaxID=3454632 RepID=UPI0019E2C47C|nr:ABC transporter ATP-binding protein [filamentous cyanobacterium LEGE 07170]
MPLTQTPTSTAPLLTVMGLAKHFPVGGSPLHPQMLHAVDHVSFAIGRGESVGLVGESGCGKSTLIRLITRLLDPTEGMVAFEDTKISQIPARYFADRPERSQIQLVFQDPTDSLNPRFTAFDTITEPLRRLGHVKSRQTLRERAMELAELVSLPLELLPRYPHQLSGGQKARVGIARAIALHPQLLVLDEPTSALDVSVQALILHLLADLKERLGMSYLFVSHDLNVVRLLCDRVLVMYLGKIVESGSVDNIFNNPAHPYTKALISAIPSFEAKPHPIPLNGE